MSDEVVEVFTAPASVVEVFMGIPGAPGADGDGGGGAWGDITGTLASQTDLQAALDAKSATGHSHAQSDVTGLTAALTAKADAAATTTALAGKASTSHTHAEADVTGLTAALAGKSATGHTHTASNVTDFNTAADARVVAGITGKLDTSAAPELIRDTMGTALVAGTNVTITPNDGADTITIAASGSSSLNGPTPSVETGVVTHTATGGTSTVSEWTVTVSAAFYLESVSFVPLSTQSFELKIDGVTVSTLAGTSGTRLTFPVAQTIAVGARTFRITAVTSATTWYYNAGGGSKAYYGVTHGFVVSGWSVSGSFEPSVLYKIAGHGSVYSAVALPSNGTWVRGSIVWNTEPAGSGYIGWVCITAGTPGTWKGFGLIQA